jgi:ABC-2 type transport system permease protein
VSALPEPIRSISHFNPFFYMIDGFRYGFTGVADGSLLAGVLMVAILNTALAVTCYLLLRAGWRLKT